MNEIETSYLKILRGLVYLVVIVSMMLVFGGLLFTISGYTGEEPKPPEMKNFRSATADGFSLDHFRDSFNPEKTEIVVEEETPPPGSLDEKKAYDKYVLTAYPKIIFNFRRIFYPDTITKGSGAQHVGELITSSDVQPASLVSAVLDAKAAAMAEPFEGKESIILALNIAQKKADLFTFDRKKYYLMTLETLTSQIADNASRSAEFMKSFGDKPLTVEMILDWHLAEIKHSFDKIENENQSRIEKYRKKVASIKEDRDISFNGVYVAFGAAILFLLSSMLLVFVRIENSLRKEEPLPDAAPVAHKAEHRIEKGHH